MTTDLQELCTALQAGVPERRAEAAEQLCHLGADAQAAAVLLVQACADESEEVREWAVAALEGLGPPLPTDVPALAPLLADKRGDVGYWAATLLGRLGRHAAPAVPALAAALSGPAALAVQQRAAWALGQIGPPAASAVAQLRPAAAGPDPRLARLAQAALQQIME